MKGEKIQQKSKRDIPCVLTPVLGADKSSERRSAIRVSCDGITVGAWAASPTPLGRLVESPAATAAACAVLKYSLWQDLTSYMVKC